MSKNNAEDTTIVLVLCGPIIDTITRRDVTMPYAFREHTRVLVLLKNPTFSFLLRNHNLAEDQLPFRTVCLYYASTLPYGTPSILSLTPSCSVTAP